VVLDVEEGDLFRTGGGLVEHPPQDPLVQAVPVVAEWTTPPMRQAMTCGNVHLLALV
jgi:hypothetical protein